MGFRSMSEVSSDTERSGGGSLDRERSSHSSRSTSFTAAQSSGERFGVDLYKEGLDVELQRLAQNHGPQQVREWAEEGMPVDTIGKPWDMEEFRDRQQERPAEVPTDIERRNNKSVQRSRGAHNAPSKAGDTQVPDSVRDVISSPGQQLDTSIQRAMEERMGDSLGDVRIHTGPSAAKACEDINARAFTVGNHVAFNHGEYDPSSAEGQHVLAHELAHVRQQTGGAVSMLPQEGELEIDPDERLEREAEETAQRVMRGGKIGVHRMRKSDVYVQRMSADGDGMLYGAVEDLQEQVSDHESSIEQNESNIQGIEDRQEQMMGTLLEAAPGAPDEFDWQGAAVKGATGAGVGFGVGAMTGSPELAGMGALIAGGTAVAKDVSKELMGTLMNNRPGGEADKLEQMYSDMAQMYQEFLEAREDHGGLDGVAKRRGD
ncbi:transposase [Natrinema thermotolerans DSM 11552]|uniref:eCIS core domain-containing protein n=1 Tax=Natrinema sp. H-ect1 TaxID=3242700 RepID=UPI0002B00EBE|nr:transposase [Natrinema thermotolerans DSM 11552]